MQTQRIRLIAIDLDGTLLGPDHRIAPADARAVADCRAAGVRVLLASGRSFGSMRMYCEQLGLTGPQITLNGGAIVGARDGAAEAVACLEEADVLALARGLCDLGIPFVAFTPSGLFALPGTPESAELEGYGEPPATVLPDFTRRNLPDPIKLLAFCPDASRDPELAALANGVTDTVRTSGGFFEFMVPGASKGEALREILRREGIPAEATLAIGDYYNDLSMFAVAGTSVAMGGAPADVRAAADFVTGPCTENGLAQALRRHVLRPTARPLTAEASR